MTDPVIVNLYIAALGAWMWVGTLMHEIVVDEGTADLDRMGLWDHWVIIMALPGLVGVAVIYAALWVVFMTGLDAFLKLIDEGEGGRG